MAEIGVSADVLGKCRLVSSLAGAPMFWLSGRITKRFGVNGVMAMSLLSYIFRFLIYATITNPWYALPAEVMRGMTFASFWASATCHVWNIAPTGLTATMLGILNAMYGGLGQSMGSLVGGILCRKVGISRTFTLCAWADATILVFFMIYQCIYLSRQLNGNQKIDRKK